MSQAGRSIWWFSFWVLANGLFLLLYPAPALALMTVDPSAEPVARIFGMVLLVVGFYYFMAGRHEAMTPFYRWTIYTRSLAFLVALVLVATGQAPPVLLLLVLVDVLGALWTWLALRRDRSIS